jgi:3alpha(or 20beta)-hydroxysteroid dehydrogenase
MDLSQDVVLVTGAASGSGAAHARAFIAAGARVVLGDVLDEQGTALAGELGERARYVHLDVSQEPHWAEAIAATEQAFGIVTVLVNNAGVVHDAPLTDYELADWHRVLDINLTGVFLGMKHVAPGMKSLRRGSIINVSSVMGQRGAAHSYSYVASKWGIRGLTRSAAIELGGYGVRVNTVLPGFIQTAMTAADDPADLEIPLRRSATPEELAPTMLFLASDASSFMTAAELDVNGGQLANIARYDALHGVDLTTPVPD